MELYLNRLKPFGKTELKLVKDGSSKDVSERLLAASEGCLRIAMGRTRRTLDHGEAGQTGAGLADALRAPHRVPHRGLGTGHTEELRSRCGHILALSKFTLQHELALVVLLEQLYRCHTILAGTPYHR